MLDTTAATIEIDGVPFAAHSTRILTAGTHRVDAHVPYRLKLQPDTPTTALNPAFQSDDWEKLLA